MNRESESSLLEFTRLQYREFEVAAWLCFPHPDRAELGTAALFLAGVDWYGHRHDLLEVADSLTPGYQGRLSELVLKTEFDLSRFSNQLRRLIDYAEAAS